MKKYKSGNSSTWAKIEKGKYKKVNLKSLTVDYCLFKIR